MECDRETDPEQESKPRDITTSDALGLAQQHKCATCPDEQGKGSNQQGGACACLVVHDHAAAAMHRNGMHFHAAHVTRERVRGFVHEYTREKEINP
jgi:hypothetical protein